VTEEKRSLDILALVQAAINGLVVLGVVSIFFWRPDLLRNLLAIELLAGLSVLAVLYYISLHQFLKVKRQGLSTLILSLITTANIVLVTAQTGGLDSPFYSFWLLVIVSSGLFGSVFTIATLAITLVAHIIVFGLHGFNQSFIIDHLPQLIVSLVAGGLAEWVYYRSTHQLKQTAATLSGQLGEEQLKANALMSSMADGVVVVDTQRRVQLMNRSALTMTGWDEASVRNLDYKLVLGLKNAAEKDLSDIEDPFHEAWDKKTSIVRNLGMLTRSGKKYDLSISVSPIYDGNQQITGAIAVFRDISKEKEVERQRNEFVSTASHEMRTPVAAIEGYISLAMNPKVATVDDRAASYLKKAHENTQHLGELFRDLLSITKIEEGVVAKHLAPVNLTDMLKDISSDMQLVASKKNLSVTFTTGDVSAGREIAPIYWVHADPERLREVVMNLVDNAIKFTPEGGITIMLSGDAKTVTVRVVDTGPGISPEDSAHLFQKFYRVDSSATRTVGGTGLGLYLCRSIIELFNGRIWVESEVGKGSSFNFTLPRIQAEDPVVKEVAPQPQIAIPAGAIKPVPFRIPAAAMDGIRPAATNAAPAQSRQAA
jgi:two-component system, OmpR family, sensor histidine kinase VicK